MNLGSSMPRIRFRALHLGKGLDLLRYDWRFVSLGRALRQKFGEVSTSLSLLIPHSCLLMTYVAVSHYSPVAAVWRVLLGRYEYLGI
jgi:hypothetical protein